MPSQKGKNIVRSDVTLIFFRERGIHSHFQVEHVADLETSGRHVGQHAAAGGSTGQATAGALEGPALPHLGARRSGGGGPGRTRRTPQPPPDQVALAVDVLPLRPHPGLVAAEEVDCVLPQLGQPLPAWMPGLSSGCRSGGAAPRAEIWLLSENAGPYEA